ncbi:helix-turn-helix domain-containing protein [Poseidonibacter ostreae]|uniref:Bacteriophage CI repressor N-terminal domain-containing protein n=1 Tax=Poseidonibacter ostreae TaxID=2654171 RepID=A0A6L4WQC4_9BACT|nr:helix-turn-helix domain-containing protein [Poseidonibacter ostreae]KAB7885190.1 hypothetical protein GA417_09160 [Poseidonibacter ostreae]KAB7886079.1 hypothetical protein GBG19_13020 [Poseidonibacter ostreae]KAB7889600.1 hypothetical protein GBG18_10625 [Poseidonibacter ostreae]
MDEITVDKKQTDVWTNKLKDILNVSSSKDVADELNISASQFSQMKNNGKFPYEKLINLMIKKKLSLDDFFDLKNSIDKEGIVPYYKNTDKYILLDGIENSKDKLRAIKQNNKFIVFDTSITEYQNDGFYAFTQNDFIIVRYFKCNIDDEDVSKVNLELSAIDNRDDKKIIDSKNLGKINFIGRVVYIIDKEDL